MAGGPRPSITGRSSTSGHAPSTPSGLRQTFTLTSPVASPETLVNDTPDSPDSLDRSPKSSPVRTHINDPSSMSDLSLDLAGPSARNHSSAAPTESTSLLRGVVDMREHVHDGPCNHGTFSPRPSSPTQSVDGTDGARSPSPGASSESSLPTINGVLAAVTGNRHDWKRKWASRIKSKKMSTSSALAERHGLKDSTIM